MIKKLALILVLCGHTCYAAEGEPIKVSFDDVMESIDICTREEDGLDDKYLIGCLNDEYTIVDSALNYNYKLLVTRAKFIDRHEKGRNALNKLINSQRSWIGYRDADLIFIENENATNDKSIVLYQVDRLIALIINTSQRANIMHFYMKESIGLGVG
ncbi:MAG: lysozyme inhibitor LprI family protein [Vibrio ordalii]|uniref:lysozyme inhibitor LprI family protein n=1 Tax=Vibrio ordalii TaxID=28174 RepID=UPI003F40AC3D